MILEALHVSTVKMISKLNLSITDTKIILEQQKMIRKWRQKMNGFSDFYITLEVFQLTLNATHPLLLSNPSLPLTAFKSSLTVSKENKRCRLFFFAGNTFAFFKCCLRNVYLLINYINSITTFFLDQRCYKLNGKLS